MACILALDGFYMDGRNIRSSYGTSKYCSAFIKNVRCNNPECTYLHQMGHIEDTFTKQEIQAGYVTSGRDVLARQQQIVEQALSAASGAAGSTPRRRTGGGGPSGTGKASSNPVFPPPSYDEPAKSTASLVPPPSAMTTKARSASTSSTTASGFPAISSASAKATPSAATTMTAASRIAASAGAASAAGKIPSATKGAATSLPMSQASRKVVPAAPSGATAASVVAGVHSVSGHSEPPAPHTTLTPLTPLKRISKGAPKSSAPPSLSNGFGEMQKLGNTRTSASKKLTGLKSGLQSGPSSTSASNRNNLLSGIGGDVISTPVAVNPPVIGLNSLGSANGLSRGQSSGSSQLGGNGLGGLGGEVFNGPLKSSSNTGSAIGSGKGKWDSGAGSSWGNVSQNSGSSGAIGGGIIGGGTIGGGNNGSSALASMLGINLPTGSGSLRETSSQLWTSDLSNQNPISSLNGTPLPLQSGFGGTPNSSNGLIGGVPIGGRSHPAPATSSGSNNSDIALLQSLLPGVQITSGGNFHGSGLGSIGGSAPGQRQGGGSASLAPGQSYGLQSLGGQPIGAIGQGQANEKQRQAPGSIW